MIRVTPQTLIMAQQGGPCVLVLIPSDDFDQQKDSRIVPIWLGMAEATNLSFALEGHVLQRPMTHTLFSESIHQLGATVDRVEIVGVTGHTFYANLILRSEERIITLDSRPSDAIAMAVLHDAPIYMTDDVLRKASYPFLFRKDTSNQKELDEFKEFVQSLTPDDFTSET